MAVPICGLSVAFDRKHMNGILPGCGGMAKTVLDPKCAFWF